MTSHKYFLCILFLIRCLHLQAAVAVDLHSRVEVEAVVVVDVAVEAAVVAVEAETTWPTYGCVS